MEYRSLIANSEPIRPIIATPNSLRRAAIMRDAAGVGPSEATHNATAEQTGSSFGCRNMRYRIRAEVEWSDSVCDGDSGRSYRAVRGESAPLLQVPRLPVEPWANLDPKDV